MILFDQKESGHINKYAYVTLVASKEYLPGAICLFHSLLRSKTQYPLIIMVTPEVEKFLQSFPYKNLLDQCIFQLIPHYTFNSNIEGVDMWKNTINKLYAYTFTEYEKLMFLDADIFILHNIDKYFEIFKNNEFMGGIHYAHNEYRIMCSSFLFSPDPQKFFNLINYIQNNNNNIYADEIVLTHYFYPNYIKQQNFKTPEIFVNFLRDIHHDAGFYKYWEFFDLNFLCKKLFYINDNLEYNDIINQFINFILQLKYGLLIQREANNKNNER